MKTQFQEQRAQRFASTQGTQMDKLRFYLSLLILFFALALTLEPGQALAEGAQGKADEASDEGQAKADITIVEPQIIADKISDEQPKAVDKTSAEAQKIADKASADVQKIIDKANADVQKIIDKASADAQNLSLKDDVSSEEYAGESQVNSALSPEELEDIRRALDADVIEETSVPKAERSAGSSMMAAIQSMNPDMALILDVALGYFSQKDHYQTGAHDPRKNGFNFQQLEMSLGASIDHYFRFDANLVFSLAGVEIEEAYVTTLSMPWSLQIRAGQFLTRVGRLNSTHPHSWDFVDQPLIIGKLYGGEGNRGLGFELSWLTPLPWYVELVGSAHMPTGNSTNRSFLGKTDEIVGPQDFLYTLAIKQFFSLHDNLGLFWGLSAQFGPNETGNGNRTDIYATDLYIKFQPDSSPDSYFVLQAENFFRLRQVPNNLLFDTGGYAQIVWQISREWQTGVRGEWATGNNGDPIDPFWTRERGRAAISAAWMGTHFSRLRAQASIDVPKWQSKPIYSLMLSLEVVAGTHPAHNY